MKLSIPSLSTTGIVQPPYTYVPKHLSRQGKLSSKKKRLLFLWRNNCSDLNLITLVEVAGKPIECTLFQIYKRAGVELYAHYWNDSYLGRGYESTGLLAMEQFADFYNIANEFLLKPPVNNPLHQCY